MSIWRTLGIKATADRAEIRRAYSRKLKQTSPEDDPAGFQALRAAYEQALNQAAWAEHAARAQETQAHEEPAPVAEPERSGEVRRSKADSDESMIEALDLEQAHEQACRRLYEVVSATEQDDDAAVDALSAVLNSPAMEIVGIHTRTEAWLAGFIPHFMPRTDPLVGPAIEYFRWTGEGIGHRPELAVLGRAADLRTLRLITTGRHPHSSAYDALRRKPVGRRLWRNRLVVGLDAKVRDFLAFIDEHHPSLRNDLDADALAWWEQRWARPYVGSNTVWAVVAGPIVLAWFVAVADGVLGGWREYLTNYGVCLALALAIVAARLYGVEWPRRIWRERYAETAPYWTRVGWAAAVPALVLLAAVVPASSVATWLIGAAAAGVALWALYTGEPDRRGLGDPMETYSGSWIIAAAMTLTQHLWRSNVYIWWQLRALLSFVYLAVFLLIAASVTSDATIRQLSVAIVPGAFAYVVGAQTLAIAWFNDLDPRRRAIGLSAALLLIPLAAAMLWLAAENEAVRPLAVALTAVLVLLHKTPAYVMVGPANRARDALMRFGWIIWLGALGPLFYYGFSHLPFAGYWLLTGGSAVVIHAVRAERDVWDRLFDRRRGKLKSKLQDAWIE